jgi:hypothetical protein
LPAPELNQRLNWILKLKKVQKSKEEGLGMHDILEGRVEPEEHKPSPYTVPVSVTLSILAVLVAMATLMGHRANTEQMLLQTQAADKWAEYQAKSQRQTARSIAADELGVFPTLDKEKTAALREKYLKETERYDKEKEKLSEEARDLEKERALIGRRANRFEGGEVVLEIALILASFTLLTNKRIFWWMGGLLGLLGVAVAASGFFVH